MWLVGVVESVGVATGCGCKEVYRFPHTYILIPTPLVYIYLLFFTAVSLLLLIFKLYINRQKRQRPPLLA